MIEITIPGGAGNGFGNTARLPKGEAGLPANYGTFSYDQVMRMGTDIAGNPPTFSQLVGGLSNDGEVSSDSPMGGGVGSLAGDGSSPNVSWIEDMLQRAALIILGFIFVGIGLNMFGRAAPVVNVVTQSPVKTAEHAASAATGRKGGKITDTKPGPAV